MLARMFGIGIVVCGFTMSRPVAAQTACDSITANALSNPSNRDTLTALHKCAAFGATIATLMGRYSLNSDTSTYGAVFDNASQVREPESFAAAMTISSDGSASTFARVSALIVLMNFASQSGVIVGRSEFLTYAGSPLSGCQPGDFANTVTPGAGVMPSDFKAQTLTLSRSVLTDGSAPVGVRHAASCLHLVAVVDSLPMHRIPAVYSFTPSTDFELLPTCGSNFKLRNHTVFAIPILVTHTGQNGGRWLNLPPRDNSASYSEVRMHYPFADIHVSYNNVIIASATTNTTACP